jgi:hypothetical protein
MDIVGMTLVFTDREEEEYWHKLISKLFVYDYEQYDEVMARIVERQKKMIDKGHYREINIIFADNRVPEWFPSNLGIKILFVKNVKSITLPDAIQKYAARLEAPNYASLRRRAQNKKEQSAEENTI